MSRRRFLAAVLLVGAGVGPILAGDAPLSYIQEEFRKGVQNRGDPVEARKHFRNASYSSSIYGEGHDTPGMWRMVGNDALLIGNVPAAVYAYRRGLELEPDDARLRRGLALARSRVAYASPEERAALTPPPDPFDVVRHPLRQWGLLVIAAFCIFAWVALRCWVAARGPRWLALFIIALAVALIVSAGWFLDLHERRANSKPFNVVMRPAILRRGDGVNFPARRDAPLAPGVEVRVLGGRGSWTQVELADGTVGWLPPRWYTTPGSYVDEHN
jgi:hypothetical protein